jgi:tetratricopeptide (TPR) repeat protein
MRRSLLVLFLACLAFGLRLQPELDDYVILVKEGDAHLALKEYSFAARAYRHAALLRSGSSVPLLRSGKAFLAQARYDRAQTALLAAHRRGGWTPELCLSMGQLYQGMGLEAEAIAQWEAVLAQDPHLAEARLQVGWAYLRREAWNDACAAFEAILARWDDAHRSHWQSAHYGLGLLWAHRDPAVALRHLQIAAGGEDQVMADKAIVVGAAVERASSSTDAVHAAALLGEAYVRVEAWSLARRALAQAVAAEPTYAEAMTYLGHVLDYLGDAARAERYLERAIQLAPTMTLTRYLLGLYYQRHGRSREAAFQYRQALKLDSRNAALYAELGNAWLAEQRYIDAEIAFRAAAELAPDHAGFQLLLARFYVDHLVRVPTHGLLVARKATLLNPEDAEAFDLLGWAYYLVGTPNEAERALSRSVALDPDLASARYHLGVVYRQLGRSAEADYQFWRAVDLDRAGYYRLRAMRALDLSPEWDCGVWRGIE